MLKVKSLIDFSSLCRLCELCGSLVVGLASKSGSVRVDSYDFVGHLLPDRNDDLRSHTKQHETKYFQRESLSKIGE